MKTSISMLGCLILGVSTLGTIANGDVIVGSGNFNNGYPFGNATTFPYSGEYQQLYSSGAFPGTIVITQIQFASTEIFKPGTEYLDFALGLETTSALPSAPGTYADNIAGGAGLTQVFNGAIAYDPLANYTFDLIVPITPFTYNPGDGSLLLDANIRSTSGGSVNFIAGLNPDVGRVFNSSGSGPETVWAGFGLETKFVTVPSAVPEPGACAMLDSLCLTAAVFLRRRRAKRKAATALRHGLRAVQADPGTTPRSGV